MSRLSHVLVASLVLLAACAHKPPVPVLVQADGTVVERPPEPKPEDEDLARGLYGEAAVLEQRGDVAGQKAKEEQLLATYPATLAAARIYDDRAQKAEKAGATVEAIAYYEKLMFYRPSYDGIDAIREKYAGMLLKVGRYADAANMLKALFKSAKSPTDEARLGQAMAQAASRAGDAEFALEALVSLASSNDQPADVRKTAERDALAIVDGTLTFKEATSLWDKAKDDNAWRALAPALGFKLAKMYYHVREFDDAQKLLELVATRFASSSFAAPARDFMVRVKARFEVNTRAIGVILPLSGKYQQYGERSLAAIKLAFKSDPSFTVVVKDTQGDASTASNVVEDLVIKDHVAAIIGPLFSNEAQAAALKAEELSVPLLALSFKDGLPQIGPFVFRTALTVETQAKELARVAFEQLGMSRFALLYPKNPYGIDFVRAFWNEVDRRKGEVRAVETYEISDTTFMDPIKRLVGRYYTNARREWFEGLAEIRMKKLPSHRVASEVERLQKSLPPVVDFDAIIIPDSGKTIGLIAPALAFEDIVLTKDPKQIEKIKKATNNEKVHPVTLLGASTWNSPQTLTSCGQDCEGAVFVDAYFPDSPDEKVRAFVTAFHDATGAEAHLSEAQAFDTAGMLRKVLTDKRPTDRGALRDALRKTEPYTGVTGSFRFDDDGESQKQLFVLTIDEGAIKKWEPTPEPPRG